MDKTIHTVQYALVRALLLEARANAGLTQTELAGRLGEAQSFVSKCERGERRLDFVELRTWCGALGITVEHFAKKFECASEEIE